MVKAEITEKLNRWMKKGTPEDLDQLIAEYSQPEVLTGLLESCITLADQAALAPRLEEAGCISRKAGKIRTVAVFYYRAAWGGIERAMNRLIHLWIDAGYRVVLLTDLPADEGDYLLPEGVKRYELTNTFDPDEKKRRIRYALLRDVLIREEADVLVTHAWLSPNLMWDLVAAKSLGIPFVIHTHGVFSCLLSEGEPAQMDEIVHLPAIYRLADAAVVQSDVCQQFWSRYQPNVRFLPDPCGPDREEEQEEETVKVKRDATHLLWVGRITGSKRPMDAVRILKEVRRSVPKATLCMVGAPDPYNLKPMEELKKLIADEGLEKAVTLEGFRKNLMPYYASAGILLNTSLYEGYGIAIAEAMKFGVPCVMYDLPYLALRKEEKGVFAVPQKDVSAAAAEIVRLMKDKKAWESAAKAAEDSGRGLDDERLKEQWKELFSSLEQAAGKASPARKDEVLDTVMGHLHSGLQVLNSEVSEYRDTGTPRLLEAVYDDRYYVEHHQALNEIYGYNPSLLLKHFLEHGMEDGLQASEEFNVQIYRDRYPDLAQAYGDDLKMYYIHYMLYGKKEKRIGN